MSRTRNAHPGRHALQLHPRVPRPRIRPRRSDPQDRRRGLRSGARDHRLLELPRVPRDRRRLRRLVPRPRRRGRARHDLARRERRHRHPPRSPPQPGRADRLHDAADQGGREARLPDRARADLDRARLDGGARADRRGARRHARARSARRPVRLAPAHPRAARPLREGRLALPRLHDGLGRDRLGLRPVAHRGLPPPRRLGRAARRRSSTCGTRTTSRDRPPIRPSTVSASARSSGSPPAMGAPTSASTSASTAPGLFGPARVDDWLEIMPWITHVHGKFFGIDENGEEPSVPVRDLIKLLVENGYNGAISSEYEGWHWNNWQSAVRHHPRRAGRAALRRRGRRLAHDHRSGGGARTASAPTSRCSATTRRSRSMTDGIAGTGIKLGTTLYSMTSEFARGAVHARDADHGGRGRGHRPGRRVQHRPAAAHLPRRRRRLREALVRLAREVRPRGERRRHEPRHGAPQGPRHDPRRGARLPRPPAQDRAHARLQEGRDPLARQGAAAQPPAAGREVRPVPRLRDPRARRGRTTRRCCRCARCTTSCSPSASASPPTSPRRCTACRRRCCARSARWAWTRSTSRSWTRSGTSRPRCTCATRSSRTT